MMAAESSHVAHGLRCSSGASNSTGIPRNATICFHDFGSGAVKIRALGLLGQTLDFSDREHLARFLREFGSYRLRFARNKRVNFVSVEPDEMAVLTDVDVDLRLVG
jgi:hypothetical protein